MYFDPENKITYFELAPSLQKKIDKIRTDLESHTIDNGRHLQEGERLKWNKGVDTLTDISACLVGHIGKGGTKNHPTVTDSSAGFISPELYLQILDIIKNGTPGDPVVGGGSNFKKGMIMEWGYGSDTIPTGWQLCNGTNGTPNLSGKFILGTSSTHPVGSTGGEETHKLTASELPVGSGGVKIVNNTGSDRRNPMWAMSTWGGEEGNWEAVPLSGTGVGGSPHNNMPPYYTLCYIMCMADDTSFSDMKKLITDHVGKGGIVNHPVVSETSAGFISPELYLQILDMINNGGGGGVVFKGSAPHGSIIPIPKGYTIDQCIFSAVSMVPDSAYYAIGAEVGSVGISWVGTRGDINDPAGRLDAALQTEFNDNTGGTTNGTVTNTSSYQKISADVNGKIVALHKYNVSVSGGSASGSYERTIHGWVNYKINCTGGGSSDRVLLKGEIVNGGTIPLPEGFTQEQCTWGFYGGYYNLGGGFGGDPVQNVPFNTNTDIINRKTYLNIDKDRIATAVMYNEQHTGNSDSDYHWQPYPGCLYYWIMGVK